MRAFLVGMSALCVILTLASSPTHAAQRLSSWAGNVKTFSACLDIGDQVTIVRHGPLRVTATCSSGPILSVDINANQRLLSNDGVIEINELPDNILSESGSGCTYPGAPFSYVAENAANVPFGGKALFGNGAFATICLDGEIPGCDCYIGGRMDALIIPVP